MSVDALAKVFRSPEALVLFDVPWSTGAKERRQAWASRFGAERALVRFVDCFQAREAAELAEVREYPTAALVTTDGRATRRLTTADLCELLRWSEEALSDLKRYTTRD